MRQRTRRRPLSFLVVVALLVGLTATTSPAAAQVRRPTTGSGQAPVAGPAKPATPPRLGELPERRTRSSTTRRNADGSLTTTIHSGPVNYRAANGSMQPIDTKLHRADQDGYAWRSGANAFQARFKDAVESGFSEFRVAGRVFRMTAEGAAASRARVDGATVSYPEAFAGTDLTYTVGTVGIKEVLDLAGPDSPASYTFRLSAADNGPAPSVRRRADGSYWVMVAGQPRPAFVLPAPTVQESAGVGQATEPAREARPSLRVEQRGRELVLTLTLDQGWLRAPGRRFPVQLDPTMLIDYTFDDGSYKASGTEPALREPRLRIGGDTSAVWRAALWFELYAVPRDAKVTDAKLDLYYDRTCVVASIACGSVQHVMDVHRMTTYWGSWNSNSTSNLLRFDPVASGSYTLAANAPVGWMKWPVTATVQSWLAGATQNLGWLIKRRTEAVNSSGPAPQSNRFSGSTLTPMMEVTYQQDGGVLLRPETVHANGAELEWLPYTGTTSGAPFASYEVHRSATPNFTPNPTTLLTTIRDQSVTSYRDTTAAPDKPFTYVVVTNGSPSYPQTVTLPPSTQARKLLQPEPESGQDTYLVYDASSVECANFGIDVNVGAGSEGWGVMRAALRFDLSGIPTTATVSSATASLWDEWGPVASTVLEAHRITRPWKEGTGFGECTGDGATWYETEAGQPWTTQGGDLDPTVAAQLTIPVDDGLQSWNDWPITGLVQSWVNGSAPNHGLILKASNESLITGHSAGFHSDNGPPDTAPKLTVTYADGSTAQGPRVSLATPGDGSTVTGGSVRLAASAEDDRRVEQVDFLVDGAVAGSDTATPFEMNWNSVSVANGTHDITVRATDDAGNQTTTSTAVRVTVDNSALPTGSLSAPAAGATVSGDVTLSASASDDRGVTSVAFMIDGVQVGAPVTASPYTLVWNSLDPLGRVFNGQHELTAVVTDTSGQQVTTAPRTFTLNNRGTSSAAAGFGLNDPATTADDVFPSAVAENTGAGVPVQDPYAGATNPDGTAGGSLGRAVSGAPSNDGGTAPVPLTQPTGSASCTATQTPDKVIDRSVTNDSKWCSSATSKWVQVQLASEQTVSAVVLRHAQAGGEPATLNTRDYDLQTSVDGVSWSTALQVRGNTAATTTHQLTPVRARYVKVAVLTPAQDGSGTARIYELEVYLADQVGPSAATGSAACSSAETPDKAIDGSLATRWCSAATGSWLQAQLPADQTVSNVVIRHAGAAGDPVTWNTRDYDLQTSVDGVAWTTQLQVRGNTASVTNHRLPAPVRIRYVKLVVVQATQDKKNTTARINELELYNAPAVAAGSAPPPACPAEAYCPTVNVTNTSGVTWSNSAAQVWYRWYAPNGAVLFEGRSAFAFPTAFAAGASQAFPMIIRPPALPPGVEQGTYRLRVEVFDPATNTLFAAKGNPPLDNPVIVAKSLATKLGLERYYQYDGDAVGAGMSTLTNVANGNMLLRWTPFFSPGRGLATMTDLTYNSLEDHSKSPAGNNFSLSISGLIRLGEPLDIHPNKADEISGQSNKWVELTDGDGTTHRFTGTTLGDGSTRWAEPAGVNLYLRSLPTSDSRGRWALTRPDKVTFFFDVDGFPTMVEDRNGNRITYVLEDTPAGEDPGGPKKRVTSVTDAAGRSFLIDYWSKAEAKKAHVRGKIQTIIDHSGSKLDFDYYDDGNLLRLTQRGGTKANGDFLADRSLVFTYTTSNGAGPAIPTVSARVNPEPRTPNQSTRIFSVRDPMGAETTYAYYLASDGAQLRWKLKERTDRLTHKTSFTYDLVNRVTRVTAPLARTTAYTYDTTGKVTQITDPLDQPTLVEWTSDFKVSKITEPKGVATPTLPDDFTTSYTYNANGYLTSQRNQITTRVERTELTYTDSPVDANDTGNHLSLLATVTQPKGVATTTAGDFQWRYSYDSAGNPDLVTDPTGAVTNYDYNLAGSANPGTVAQVLDANGNPPTVFEAYHASGQPTVIRDPLGHRTRLDYNADGQARWIQDPNHENDTGTDERAYRTFFDYDSFGRLGRQSAPKSTSAERGTLLWSGVDLDANDNALRSTAPHYGQVSGDPESGAVTTTSYDKMDRPLLTTGPDTSADPAGERTRTEYDDAGRPFKVTGPKGVASATDDDYTTLVDYDPLDRVIRQTQYGTSTADKRITHLCYDLAGDLRSVTAPRAGLATVICPGTGPLTGVGFTSSFDYDEAHRRTASRDPLGHETRTGYDANGNVASTEQDITTGRVARSTVDYDQRDAPVTITQRLDAATNRNVTSRIEYDPNGNRTRMISPRANDAAGGSGPFTNYVTAFTYDAANQLTRITLPFDARDGTERQYLHRAYDAGGNLLWASLPVTSASATSVQDSARTVETYFDPGWVRSSKDPTNPKVRFDYTAQGLQAERTPERTDQPGIPDTGKQMTWAYFADTLLKQRTDQGGQAATYAYDANNNLTSATNASGLTDPGERPVDTQVSYTGFDEPAKTRLRKQGAANWTFSTASYDPNGNVKDRGENGEETDAGTQTKPPRSSQYTYDQADWVSQQLDLGTDGTCKDDQRIVTSFWSTGWNHQRDLYRAASGCGSDPTTWPKKQTTTWSQFDNGLPRTLDTVNGSGVTTESHTVGYTDDTGIFVNGNRTTDRYVLKRGQPSTATTCLSTTAPCDAKWTYDARDRLVSHQLRAGKTNTYTYDQPAQLIGDQTIRAGNLTTQVENGVTSTRTYTAQQLTTATSGGATGKYWYDPLGNLDCVTTSAGTQADCSPADGIAPSANLVADNAYDYLNRLASIRSYAAGTRTDTASYTYDALDRTTKEIEDHAGTAKDRTTSFAFQGLTNLVTQEQQAGGSNPKTKTYDYDAFGHRLSLTDTTSGGTSSTYSYASDVHGSVSQLLDDAGNVTASYGYSAYGGSDASSSDTESLTRGDPDPQAPLNPYRYASRRMDSGTVPSTSPAVASGAGGYDMGARRFGPDIGAFLQQDQFYGALSDLGLALDPLTQNRYGLAGGNPISYVEGDGHIPTPDNPVSANPTLNVQLNAAPSPSVGAYAASREAGAGSSGTVGTGPGDICARLGVCRLSPHPTAGNQNSFVQQPAHAPCGARDWAEGFHSSPLTLDFGSTCLIQMMASPAPGLNVTTPGLLNLSSGGGGTGGGIPEEAAKDLEEVAQKAARYHGLQSLAAQLHRVTTVLRVRSERGDIVDLIGTSEPRLDPKQRALGRYEAAVQIPGHAEESALNGFWVLG